MAALGCPEEEGADDSAVAIGEDCRALADEEPALGRYFCPGFLCALHEQSSVAQEVLAQVAEVAAGPQGTGPVEGLNEVALEEVRAGGQGDPVWY